MPTDVTTLVSHDQKSGTNKKGIWTLNKFTAADDRQYDTFDKEIASKALGLLGQAVEVSYEERQNGDFTNYTLTDVGLHGNGAQAAAPVTVSRPAVDDRQTMIMRQSGLERAILSFAASNIDPVENQAELLELSDQYIDYFIGGRESVGVVPD